jgi:hypothetical protein
VEGLGRQRGPKGEEWYASDDRSGTVGFKGVERSVKRLSAFLGCTHRRGRALTEGEG